MKSNVFSIIYGFFGITATQITDDIVPTGLDDIDKIVKVLVQIIIGIATLISLFRRKKSS